MFHVQSQMYVECGHAHTCTSDLCHSYDETTGQMDPGYPRYIFFDFRGIGLKVDAAFENYGNTAYSMVQKLRSIYLKYIDRRTFLWIIYIYYV